MKQNLIRFAVGALVALTAALVIGEAPTSAIVAFTLMGGVVGIISRVFGLDLGR